MDVQAELTKFLNVQKVPYKRLEHEASRTSRESAAQRGDSTLYGAKALVLKVKNEFILFVMRANLRLDFEKVQMLTGVKAKKIRFATSDELLNLTGLVSGAVPPFGYPILPLHLYIDQSIADGENLIGFNAGSLTASIKMNKEDYLRIAGGQLTQFTSIKQTNETHHEKDTPPPLPPKICQFHCKTCPVSVKMKTVNNKDFTACTRAKGTVAISNLTLKIGTSHE